MERKASSAMYEAYEGDLVRPLGFVTLYSAYAEGELDELLSVLPSGEPYDNRKREWTIGRKLNYALKLVGRLQSPSLADLEAALKEAKVLFAQRNQLVHGRLFSGGRLVSSRIGKGKPDQLLSGDQIVRLAEDIFNWKERVWACRCRQLLPVLVAMREGEGAQCFV